LRVDASPTAARSQPPWPSRDALAEDLYQLRNALFERWAYLQDKRGSGVVIDRLWNDAVAALADVHTPDDFLRVLERFVAGLQDGHGYARLPSVASVPRWMRPFWLRDVREGVAVAAIDPVAGQELERGDLVVAVDDIAVEKWLAERMAMTAASTPESRRYRALATVGLTDRPRSVVTVERGGRLVRIDIANVPARSTAPDAVIVSRWLADGAVGYIAVPTFMPADRSRWSRALDEAFRKHDNARALVIDLRGNSGGTDLLGQALCDHLIDPGYIYFRLSARMSPTQWSVPESHRVHGSGPVFHGPVAVLVDEGTFSAADDAAAALQDDRPNTIFVGRRSGGGTGAPREVVLDHSGAAVTFCTMRVYRPRGDLIEGRGVWPDEPVRWTAADLRDGRDPDVDTAVRIVLNRASRR
jgi:carboxyl-terminal processing protease